MGILSAKTSFGRRASKLGPHPARTSTEDCGKIELAGKLYLPSGEKPSNPQGIMSPNDSPDVGVRSRAATGAAWPPDILGGWARIHLCQGRSSSMARRPKPGSFFFFFSGRDGRRIMYEYYTAISGTGVWVAARMPLARARPVKA